MARDIPDSTKPAILGTRGIVVNVTTGDHVTIDVVHENVRAVYILKIVVLDED